MKSEKQYPKFVVGAFIIDIQGRLFLRTTPSQNNKFTCINGPVEWGKTIEETLRNNVKEKTNLDISNYELIGLTDGLHIPTKPGEAPIHLVFADYRVLSSQKSSFSSNEKREHAWLKPSEWLAKGREAFGPYIYEIIEKLV